MKKSKELIEGRFSRTSFGSLDSKKRITLGNRIMSEEPLRHMDIDSFEIFVGDNGDILLRPCTHIPSQEAWLHKNPVALKRVQDGLEDLKKGKTKKVKNLKQFLDEL